jgi:shikimate dehydrogenase
MPPSAHVVITGSTGVLAIPGDPLEHARAPGVVSAMLAERGQDAVLVPLRVERGTSLGMRVGDALPFDPSGLGPDTIAADIVIRPEPTPFLAAAAVPGCTLQHGLPMLVEQIGQMIDFMIGPCDGRPAR